MNKRKATGEPPERKPPSRKAKFDAIAGIKESLAVRQAPPRRLAKHPKPLTRTVDPVPVNAHQRLFDALETSFRERSIQVMRGLHYHQEFARSKHNPRNTEDSVHGLHEITAHNLCERNYGTVTPVPQFRITAPLPPDMIQMQENPPQQQSSVDENISVRTERASRATTWQSIPDLSVMLLGVELRDSTLVDEITDVNSHHNKPLEDSSALSHIFSMNSYLPERFFRVTKVELPVLEELKPPFPRNTDISQFLSHMTSFGTRAKQQARIQGLCLFSSNVFRHQHTVILLAAVGEWFAFSRLTREILDHDNVPFKLNVRMHMNRGVDKAICSGMSDVNNGVADSFECADDDDRFSSYIPSSPPSEHVEVRRNLRSSIHFTSRVIGSSDTEDRNLPEDTCVAPVAGAENSDSTVQTREPTSDYPTDRQHHDPGPSSQTTTVQATTMDSSTFDAPHFFRRPSHHRNETVHSLASSSHIGDGQTAHQHPVQVPTSPVPPLSQGNDPSQRGTSSAASIVTGEPNETSQKQQEILGEANEVVERATAPYSDDDLNQLWTLRKKLGIVQKLSQSEDPTMDEHGDTNPKFVNNEQFTPPTGVLWSPWMKLGSPACSSMLQHVAEEVSKKAEASETEFLTQLTTNLLQRVEAANAEQSNEA